MCVWEMNELDILPKNDSLGYLSDAYVTRRNAVQPQPNAVEPEPTTFNTF